MNEPMQILYDEHAIIANAVEAVHKARTLIGKDEGGYNTLVSELIHFFRNYADKYHHFKEEEILFPEMCKKNELLADGVIFEMLDNHSDFREMIGSAEESLNNKDYTATQKTLEKYTELLLEHIAVENEELFQMANSLFTNEELERIKYRFDDSDRDLGMKEKLDLEKKNF